jgi:hypothetical protein
VAGDNAKSSSLLLGFSRLGADSQLRSWLHSFYLGSAGHREGNFALASRRSFGNHRPEVEGSFPLFSFQNPSSELKRKNMKFQRLAPSVRTYTCPNAHTQAKIHSK